MIKMVGTHKITFDDGYTIQSFFLHKKEWDRIYDEVFRESAV